jgi:hypothetical protein
MKTAHAQVWNRAAETFVELTDGKDRWTQRVLVSNLRGDDMLRVEVEAVVGVRNRRRAVNMITMSQAKALRDYLSAVLGDPA